MAKDFLEGFIYNFQSKCRDFRQAAENIVNNVSYDVKSTAEKVTRDFSGFAEGIEYEIRSKTEDAKQAMVNIQENIKLVEEEKARKDAENRADFEDIASYINPVLGQTVKNINNLMDTINNTTTQTDPCIAIKRLSETGKHDFEYGDHLMQLAIGFTHHGIYVGDNKVVHYTLNGIKEVSLNEFIDNSPVRKMTEKESPALNSPPEIVRKARSRVGEREYNLLFKNCENFARWCRTDKS